MIIVKLNGGLGNQMFQYALGKHLAVVHNTVLKLDTSYFNSHKLRKYELDVFRIEDSIIQPSELQRYLPVSGQPLWRKLWNKVRNGSTVFEFVLEKQFTFSSSVLSLRDNVYLEGYWQSEKYFIGIEKQIRKAFQLKEPLDNENKLVLDKINHRTAVSIHVRRGDYVTNSETNKVHGTCDLAYYQRAIDYVAAKVNNPLYVVFSDDQQWVQANLKVPGETYFVTNNQGERSYIDLYLMSACNHHIIANSSFSWWGAWLNSSPDKIVVAPLKWFNEPSRSTIDLIPTAWMKL